MLTVLQLVHLFIKQKYDIMTMMITFNTTDNVR